MEHSATPQIRLSSTCYQRFTQALCDLVDRVAEFDDALQIVSGNGTKLGVIWSADAEHGTAEKAGDRAAELRQHCAELAGVRFKSDLRARPVLQPQGTIELDSRRVGPYLC